MPRPVQGSAERVALWTEVLLEAELDDEDQVLRNLEPVAWHSRRKKLDQLGGPPTSP